LTALTQQIYYAQIYVTQNSDLLECPFYVRKRFRVLCPPEAETLLAFKCYWKSQIC